MKMYKNIGTGKLRGTTDSTPWWTDDLFEDMDDVLNTLELLYSDVINDLPRQGRLKLEPTNYPEGTTEVRKALNKRYSLLCKWQRKKVQHDHDSYKKARDSAKKSFKSAESNYWKAEFQESRQFKGFSEYCKESSEEKKKKENWSNWG